MAKLATVEALRIRLNLGDIDDVNLRASAALESATIHLSSLLRTRFERQTVVDKYWIDPEQEPWRGNFFEIYLTNGFVFEDAGALPDPIIVELRLSEFIGDLAVSDIVPDTILIKELNKGLVMITDDPESNISLPRFRRFNQFYIQATYTCGFESSTNKFGKNYKLVPDWLEEAALLQAMIAFNSDCGDGEKVKDSGAVNIAQNNVVALVERYIRYYPSARKPIQ